MSRGKIKKVYIEDLPKLIGHQIRIAGWVHKIRDQKKVQFLILRDRTGLVQTVIDKNSENNEMNSIISSLTRESVLEVEGELIENPIVKLGGIELKIANIKILSNADETFPIDPFTKENIPQLEKRMDWRWLDLRTPRNFCIFEIQTILEMEMRNFFINQKFIEIHTPKLMGTASESGSELFKLDYFGKEAYLAQSPQFYKQMAISSGFDKVFEIGPVFRANPSFTTRHDTEFTSIDVEIGFIENHEDVMNFEERWIQYFMKKLKKKFEDKVKELFGVEIIIPSIPFPRIKLEEVIGIIESMGYILNKKGDLDPQAERLLSKYVKEKYNHEFVFVTDFPVSVRPFYHMQHENDPDLTKSFDLLYKGLEITTGAQREHRYHVLVKQAKERGLNLGPLTDYLNFFKYGCPPHGGYGFGLTRFLIKLLNLPTVKDATFVPRDPKRLNP